MIDYRLAPLSVQCGDDRETMQTSGIAWKFFARMTLAACAGMFVTACVSLPTAEDLRAATSPHLSPGAPSGITDERAEFRQYFCKELSATDADRDCDAVLHRLSDEQGHSPMPAADRADLQVLFVTGAFSECFDDDALPFASAIAARADTDDDFGTIVVGGRSGTSHNAAQIAAFLESWPVDPSKPLALVGYSKGTIDILQFLVDYPDLANDIDAVVSVAGAVRGSPVADRYGVLYDLLFAYVPTARCEKGDGDVVADLRTDVRRTWLEEHALPDHVRYYSLAAFTTRDLIANGLVSTWKSLLRDDSHNDGQVLARDALLPNSSLLGYANADHWAVAMELQNEHPLLAGRHDDTPFPHAALLGAILGHVGSDLAASH